MAALIANGDRRDACTPVEGDDLGALVVAPKHGTAGDRLQVYAGGYAVRVQEALAETFPAVAHVVGGGAFAELVRRYIETTPLRSYNLNDAGAALPRFLRDDLLTAGLPFLPDLARLEWQVARAFHAHAQPALDPAALAGWSMDDWGRAILRLQPWVAIVRSDWPIREIWESRDTPIEDINIALYDRPDRVLVRRAGDAVLCESLDDAEADALGALLEGQPLGSVVAALTPRGGDPATVSAWFARWMALRMIADCLIH
ncbi:MAG TPA: DNA-binding domain-containing protein [Candidatus Margulisiibacteriota bacterium]|nr:DNA-binding domain-containing protein [Candidatus Margulisiibacteriota bacterium]